MEKKITEKITNLWPRPAVGPDGIGLSLLKNFQEVAPVLKIIFQRSLTDVEVPEDWRTVNVTPIFKKGVQSDPGNNRPVSLASVC